MKTQSNELIIDLENEKFDLNAISNLNEITEISFGNYKTKIEIPLTLNEFPNITKLSFYEGGSEVLYETPDNLEKCIHIKDIEFNSVFDLEKMRPMPHLEQLTIEVKNTETDTKKIVTLFPNLKKVEISGYYLENQKLPDEIENLSLLESISLVSCGLNSLPDSLVSLKQLKELSLYETSMVTLPEVISQLVNLEVLNIDSGLTKLPDSLINLKKLKELDLYGALNGGNMDVADNNSFITGKIYLKPIPEVIGKLENLEVLNLDACGVFDITPIFSLKNLKKLSLQFSALKDCEGFSNFPMLEELSLEACYDIQNLDGLKGLPLKKLNLSDNQIKSIDVISSLKKLETLELEYTNTIKDYSPLYIHTTIKELKANDIILKKWKNSRNSRKGNKPIK